VLLTIHQARRNAWVYRNVAGSDASASQSGRGAPLTPLTACPRDVPFLVALLNEVVGGRECSVKHRNRDVEDSLQGLE